MKSMIRARLTKPMIGAPRNAILLAACGMMVSLPSSLKKSYMGWRIGGPTLFCIFATILRSIPVISIPATKQNRKPGKIRIYPRYTSELYTIAIFPPP